MSVDALSLQGHSADGLGLVIPDAGLLLPGDYLSSREIPFVDDLDAYRAFLTRLRGLLGWLERVIPGHGPELDRAAAVAVLDADADYLDALAEHATRSNVAGALSIPLPRAGSFHGMKDRHREDCKAVGLQIND